MIVPILQVIFQRSLSTGRVPKDWSTAFVCSLFKKGDTSLASNYRPISLTSILCKVLEHVVTTNIVSHMDKYNLLYDLQHSFRSKRFCETHLVTLIEDLMRNSIAGNQPDLVLIDFSKAFNKVSHQKLLLKLHRYGIRGTTLKWIQAFLSDRTQTVVIDNEKSATVPVTSGVPQQAFKWALLFLFFLLFPTFLICSYFSLLFLENALLSLLSHYKMSFTHKNPEFFLARLDFRNQSYFSSGSPPLKHNKI